MADWLERCKQRSLPEKGAAMKILVVGAGRMGSIRAEDLAADPRVTELSITNRNSERAGQLAESTGAQVVAWESMAESAPDAVVVAVGTDAHDHVLAHLLPLGLPVLCEKPVALTLEGTQQAIDLAGAHGSRLQIGFQRRFDSAIRGVYDAIQSGNMGTLYSLAMTSHDHMPSGKEFMAGSGGIFRDLHVHDFDLVRWLTSSDIKTVYATKAVREHHDYAEFDDADVSMINVVTHSGVQVTISGARHDAVGHDVRLVAFGSLNSLSAGLNQRTPLNTVEQDLALTTRPYTGFVDRFREAFRNETHSFVSFAAGEIDNPCPADSALESLRVAIAAEESIATGCAVDVSAI
jgi:myo-inositol 2-dehydrogenase/D-chiro-inositol 1-dehydrogenase